MSRVAECVFCDKSNGDLYGLFHAMLSVNAGEALRPAVNGKQDESLPVKYPANTSQSNQCKKQPQPRVTSSNNAVAQ
ncbi:hypothetical protein NB694_004534 [Pantoea ananatis]|nr:hypothetical protein [Pantoea ananatis]